MLFRSPGLTVEATAPDGVIEAVRLDRLADGRPATFALGVQWHPEWHIRTDRLAKGIFEVFGDAARERAVTRPDSGAGRPDLGQTFPISAQTPRGKRQFFPSNDPKLLKKAMKES